MAQNINVHVVTGNLVADPTKREYDKRDGSGKGTIAEFRIAVNRRPPRGGGEGTADFFTIKAFDGLGDNCVQYLSKGKKVLVVGRHQIDEVDRRDGAGKAYFQSFVATDVEFLTPVGSSNGSGPAAAAEGAAAEEQTSDVPF
jgi:single-strand DNA-binding protein